ncbi:MAG: glycosyltransferase family 4 protein [Actinomycetes bacterium]
MRIQIVSGHGEVSGGEQMLLRIATASAELGHRVVVVGPRWGELREACAEHNLRYHGLPGASRRSYAGYLVRHLLVRRDALVWANGAMPALAATLTPDPLVVHLHQDLSTAQAAATALVRARARALVVPSHNMQQRIPGSVALSNWTRRLAVRAPVPRGDTLTIGFVGRLSLDKGVDLLAVALDEVATALPKHRIRLLIAGDDRFVPQESASQVAFALGAAKAEIVRLGWVDPAEVYRQAHVCVVPSRWAEPFGLVAAEAMAVGCPLVVSDAGALPEVTGADYPFVFRAGDAGQLSETVASVLTQDCSEQTSALRVRWESEYSPDAGRRRLGELLAWIAASASGVL